MTTKTDEEIMLLYAQKGDEEAFLELYHRYAAKLYGYLVNRVRRGLDCEAILQDTFMKLHGAKERYRPEYPFSVWLFAICRNTLIDHVRKEERLTSTRQRLASEGPESSRFSVPETEISESVLNQLPADQKLALELRYLESLPFEVIAKKLERSEQNIRQLVSRAIRRLRRLMVEK